MECFDDNTAVEFFEGTLSDSAQREIEAHAAVCSPCRQLLAELARSPSLAGVSPTIPAAGDAHIDLQQGDEVGRFAILHRIGHGGMGVVFAAYDPKLDRKVALKLLRSSDDSSATPEEAQARLLREAQAIAHLSHPNVVSVYDVGTYKSEVYIAMEFVEGSTLTDWLRRYRRPWRDCLDKFLQAGRALAAAHGAGLAHRDFKPDNVLVGHDERVRVMDFGLARSLFHDPPAQEGGADGVFTLSVDGVSELNRSLTKTGAVLGTPRYMAPEQFLGHETDARSDQFSFCVAFYEALFRQHPFEGKTARVLLEDPDRAAMRPPPEGTDVPAWLLRVLERGMQREPAKRYGSMELLLQEATPHRTASSTKRWVAVAGALAVAVMLLAFFLYRSREEARSAIDEANAAKKSRDQATEESRKARAAAQRAQKELATLKEEARELRRRLIDVETAEDTISDLRDELIEKQERIAELEERLDRRATAPPRRARLRGLEIPVVRRYVRPQMESIKACFREWRERAPDRAVTLIVRFAIHTDGTVRSSRILGVSDKVLNECVTGLLGDVTFPAADGVTIVDYTFATTTTAFDVSSRIADVRPPPEDPGPAR